MARWSWWGFWGLLGCGWGCASGSSAPPGDCGGEACPRGLVCVEGVCARPLDPEPGPGDGGGDAFRVADGAPEPEPVVDVGVDVGVPDGGVCRPGERRLCGQVLGLCRRGQEVCGADGQFGACEGATGPTDEGCNGADDDCDGQVDEGFGLGEVCEGVGRCGAGVVECRSFGAVRCSTDPGGAADEAGVETCDGADDDCDGRTDEDFGAGEACMGRCGPGVRECSGAGVPVCSTDPEGSEREGRVEGCDGADNDCDGVIDEGFLVGEACVVAGVCGAGVYECGAVGRVCSSGPGGSGSGAGPERCNAADDDCDGVVDEGLGLGGACVGALPCGQGMVECDAGGGTRCSTDPGGSVEQGLERCNGADDDCDGSVDEGLPIGQGCPAAGRCGASVLVCGAGERLVCATHPGGPQDASRAETCEGVDDDCDGRVDEGLGLGAACVGRGACGPGVAECGPGGVAICSSERGGSGDASREEVCDQRDDDCDGRIDEGGVCGGEACAGGIALSPGETVSGDTRGLVDDYARANCLGDAVGPDQVFRFDVPAAGPYVVGVAPLDALFDPLFWIAGDCVAADAQQCLQPDARQTAEGRGRPEAVALNFIRGGRFALTVDGRAVADAGPFAVTVGPVDAGERCGTAQAIPVPGRYVGTTARRQGDVAMQGCPAGVITTGPDQVFRFDLAAPARVRAAVTSGVAVRAVVSIVGDCGRPDETCAAGAAAGIAGEAVAAEAALAAGTWFVVVDHPVNTGGPFLLTLSVVD